MFLEIRKVICQNLLNILLDILPDGNFKKKYAEFILENLKEL